MFDISGESLSTRRHLRVPQFVGVSRFLTMPSGNNDDGRHKQNVALLAQFA
jgi:hypothetical protein